MTTVLICLLILTLLPLTCAWTAAFFKNKQLGSVDNKEPRTQALSLSGPGARAVAAQANCWEAVATFTVAILAVFISGLDMSSVATLAIVFVALRVIYIPLYIADLDKFRSLVFLGGLGICIYMFKLAISAS